MSFFISFLKEQHIKYHKSKGKNFGRAQGGGGGGVGGGATGNTKS